MKRSYSPDRLKWFNRVGAPLPYNRYGKKRFNKLNDLYAKIFSRAAFNGTGDVKFSNSELSKIVKISPRQVVYHLRTLEKLGQIKTLNITNYTGNGVRVERIIRVLAAHAHINYRYKPRAEVFGKRWKDPFDYSLLDNVVLEDMSLRHRTQIEVADVAVIPEWADNPEYISKPGFLEAYKPITDIYETGMDSIAKLRESVIPGFLIQEYYKLRAGWDELDFHAILILGGPKAVRKTANRLTRNSDEHVPSIEA
jgi:DNA-binding transcriptional ArsR family regulator